MSGYYANDDVVAMLRPYTLDAWIFHPLYERQTRAWVTENILDTDGVMIDVGAHCGSFSLRHRRSFREIYAFEPSPVDYAALIRNIELNDASEIVPVPMAASDASGEARLYLGTPGTHSLHKIGSGEFVEVKTTTLDGFAEGTGLNPRDIRLIKIDVEGAELSVLRGSEQILRGGAPALVVEANTARHENALQIYLADLGYHQVTKADGRNLIFEK